MWFAGSEKVTRRSDEFDGDTDWAMGDRRVPAKWLENASV
jgi:hypothetical protein